MGINTDKNSYTQLFAIGKTIVVGTLLTAIDSSFLVGLLIGLAILTYYPMFIALTLSGILLIYFSFSKEHFYRAFLGFTLGVASVGFLVFAKITNVINEFNLCN